MDGWVGAVSVEEGEGGREGGSEWMGGWWRRCQCQVEVRTSV